MAANTEKISTSTKGGARAGSGRKKGSPNKKTAEVQKAVAESGTTPLEYMLQVMRNPLAEEHQRLDAAKSAAPYVHAKLSSIEMNAKVDLSDVTDDSIEGKLADLIGKAGIAGLTGGKGT